MHLAKSLLASAVLLASAGAHAVVDGSRTSGPSGVVVPLFTESAGSTCSTAPEPSNDCTIGALASPVATISGGKIYNDDLEVADDVLVSVPFLAAGPSSGTPILTFVAGVTSLGFRWGSPDQYNILTIRDSDDVDYVFTTATLGFTEQGGNQNFSQYVQFIASADTFISRVTFSSTSDAFETTQFTISPIPEPETYALMLAGLAALGYVGRRRRPN